MKKALFVATIDSHIKAFHLPYLKLLKDMGYEVHVATNGDEQFQNCDVKHQICIERSPFSIKNVKAIKQLKRIIDNGKFEIVHCHTPMGAVVTRLAAKHARNKYGTKVFYTAHGFHFYKGASKLNWITFYPVEKYLAKYTDTLITINNEDFELAKSKFSKRCKSIKYIPGVGVDIDKFNKKVPISNKIELKKSLNLSEDDIILSCVARLDKNKNQIFLINAMEKIVKNNSKIHLLLVGPDELDGFYQKIVNEKKLNDYIHFLGRREDIPDILAITDVVVSSSLREGLPVNVIEAMSIGLPVVALKCRGMDDLIENGVNGQIISNYEEFYQAIFNYINNKHLLKNVKESNLKIINNYSYDSLIKKMKDIYINGR